MINWKYIPVLILKFVYIVVLLIGLLVGVYGLIELVYYVFSFVGR